MNNDSRSDILKNIREKDATYWDHVRETAALRVFHDASERVPAYKDFLKKNNVNPEHITTFADFAQVPLTNKKNYLRHYPYEALYRDGRIATPLTFTATSGSTGEPFYFSRDRQLEMNASIIHELFFTGGTHDPRTPTLVIVCFGMGIWIGGTITYRAFEMAADRSGYPISMLTPGINKEEIFKSLKNVAPHFKQIIIAGYPPFIKDIIDEAPERGITLADMHVRFIFAAEGFTERFREYIAQHAGILDPARDTMNIYGSADIGTMAFETPLAIHACGMALKKPELSRTIFPIGSERTPTLAQYVPSFITFEAPDGEIVLTGDNALPLIRYSIGDHGGIFSYSELLERCSSAGVDLAAENSAAGLAAFAYQLPFVYVYERIDMSVKLYGAIIFPEYIKSALLEKRFEDAITGKFTMFTRNDKKHDEYLELNIELKSGSEEPNALKKALSQAIVESLGTHSAEYKNNMTIMPKKIKPKITLWPQGHPAHFQEGVKQKWVTRLETITT